MTRKIHEFLKMPLDELIFEANRIRKENINEIELCSILNAKSGYCTEDCKFCAQSSHHKTNVSTYSLLHKEDMIKAARAAKNNGARRFGIVTSGNRLNAQELECIAEVITELSRSGEIFPCASLGIS